MHCPALSSSCCGQGAIASKLKVDESKVHVMYMLEDVAAVVLGSAATSSSDRFRLEDHTGSVRAVQAALRLLTCKSAAHAPNASLASCV